MTPIPPKWKQHLSDADINMCLQVQDTVDGDRKTHTIYPPEDKIFTALELTNPEDVKCIIVGQDPYHGRGQAQGLAFSVSPDQTPPPSLVNILHEYSLDLNQPTPKTGDLTPWAKNGVLLLNTILTVEEGTPLSHEELGWQYFTTACIKIALQNDHNIIMLNWGQKAINLSNDILSGFSPNKKVVCYNTTHPSPYSANNQYGRYPAFMGSKPFTTANTWLTQHGETPINWTL